MTTVARILLPLGPLCAILLAWQLLVPRGSKMAFLLGRPDEIGAAAVTLAGDPTFWRDFLASTSVLVEGYVAGVILGFAIGLMVWAFGRSGRVLEQYLIALGSVPLFAVAPLLIFVFGVGAATRLLIVSVSVLIPMALAAASSAKDTERRYQDLLRSFPRARMRELKLVIAPGALFNCLPVLKPAANTALVAVFLSEWISAQNGLAKFVLASMSIYNVPQMWVGLLTFVLLGVVFGVAVDLVERRVTKWRLS